MWGVLLNGRRQVWFRQNGFEREGVSEEEGE